jgi:hypothetical protein
MAKEKLLPRPSKPQEPDEWVCLQATREALALTIKKARGGRFLLRYRAFNNKRGWDLIELLGKSGWRIGYLSPKYLAVIPAAQSARVRRKAT